MPRVAKSNRVTSWSLGSNLPSIALAMKIGLMARRFLRLAKFDSGAFERLNRHETALWRQAAQLLFALNFLHRPAQR
jgi:hypothetical protein